MTQRKPADERQGRGTADIGALEVFAGPTPDVPVRVDGEPLHPEVAAQWDDLWKTHVASAINGLSDGAALVRLFRLRDAALRLFEVAMMEPMVPGSQDQEVRNPLFAVVSTMHKEILALEDRFGLSPSARMKLGISIGEAAAAGKKLDDINAEFEQEGDLPE